MRRFLQTLSLHPYIVLVLLVLGPLDGCPVG
jgi:hypothetical protein